MTGNPWPSIIWTAASIGFFLFLPIWIQEVSDRRRARQQAARPAIPQQRKGEQ